MNNKIASDLLELVRAYSEKTALSDNISMRPHYIMLQGYLEDSIKKLNNIKEIENET